jgi:hypothetical protein
MIALHEGAAKELDAEKLTDTWRELQVPRSPPPSLTLAAIVALRANRFSAAARVETSRASASLTLTLVESSRASASLTLTLVESSRASASLTLTLVESSRAAEHRHPPDQRFDT